MNKTRKIIATGMLVGAVALTGCSSDEGEIAKEIDFDKVEQGLSEALSNSDNYSNAFDSCDVSYNEDTNDLDIVIAVHPSTDPSVAIGIADYSISTINYEAQRQNSEIADYSASNSYYGGLFDDVNAFIMIAPTTAQSEDEYYIFESIPVKSHRELKLND